MRSNNWLTAVIVLTVGILLVVWHNRIDVLNWIVVIVGLGLVVPGLYSLISAFARAGSKSAKKDEYSAGRSTIIASLGALALGVWMIVSPGFFVELLAYMFGAILIVYGVFHIVFLSVCSRPYIMPGWYYIIPVLMIGAGVVILATSVRTMNSVVVLISGIALIASAFNTMLEIAGTHPARLKDSGKGQERGQQPD